MQNLLEKVTQTIRALKPFHRGEKLVVAVSGGVDSVVLLHILNQLAFEFDWKLVVAHFNHQLRGRSSDADERFVAKLAARLNLPFHTARADVKAHARKSSLSIEMSARELRHEFLATTARRLKFRTIALAHHADDQVEQFFLRVLRGAGGRGLAGMRWRAPSPADERIQVVRPLLDVSRAEIETFARANQIPFRDDASNASSDMLRNRIRHELLPLLRRRFQPALDRTVLRLMEIVGAETAAVEESARRWCEQRRPRFQNLPVAMQRAALRLQLHRRGFMPDFELIEALRASPDRPVMIAPVTQAVRDPTGGVTVRRVNKAPFRHERRVVALKGRAGTANFARVQIVWSIVAQEGARLSTRESGRETFDADKVGPSMVLRHWQPGDRFQPIGMNAPVKLQDWFTNQGVARERRRDLVIATTAEGEIFWVEEQRIGEKFKITADTTRGLRWQWEGE